MVLAYLIIFVFFLSLYYYFTRNFNQWKKMGIVGPKPVPFFGNVLSCALRRKNYGVFFSEVYEAYPEEKVVGLFRMTTPALLIRDLDIIKHIMVKDFDAFDDRGVRFSDEFLGQNLFNAESDKWRLLRAKFSPIFTSATLRNMLPLVIDRADNFIKYLKEITVDQSEHDVHALAQKYTMANIGACTLGLNIDTQYDPDMVEALKKFDKFAFDYNYSNEIDYMYPGILKVLNSSIFFLCVKKFITDILKDAMGQRKGSISDRKDFLDLILEMRHVGKIRGQKQNEELTFELTDDIIIAQAFVFFAAGYATSAVTVANMLYELAKNQEIQDKVVADIERGLKKHGGEVTLESLQDMTYLGQVFDETLRKYPQVDPLQRQAQVDYKLPGTDITIPRGTFVLVSGLGVHRDPNNYPDPLKFDPDRFAPENCGEQSHPAYMPFGTGPRNCIGTRFAKIQSRVCMVKLMSNFRVYPSKNTTDTIPICPKKAINGPRYGVYLNLVRR